MKRETSTDACKVEQTATDDVRAEIPGIVRELVHSCGLDDCYDHVGPEPIPTKAAIIEILETTLRVLFPGYFTSARIDPINLEYYLGQKITALFQRLCEQTALAIRHECLRYDLACTHCSEKAKECSILFLRKLPELRRVLGTDVRAGYEGDPAAKSVDEIIFSYPGLYAIAAYRTAHELYHLDVPLLPRIMTEHAHSLTGIDIHPAAHIGQSFFIDHGTGVVVGETTEIGDRVRLYQGVTLGALSLPKNAGDLYRDKKRHPTIEDDVIIYAGATILGGDTRIGARSVVGGNVWLTESVPPDTKVTVAKPELVFKGPSVSSSVKVQTRS